MQARGLRVEVTTLPDQARTAEQAAAGLGVEIGQIVKSLVFLKDGEPVLVLCAGDRRVDADRLRLARAPADVVRDATGFAIGGIPPLGHDNHLPTMIDSSLLRFTEVWAAAGTPHDVFRARTDDLIAAIPDAELADVS